MNDVVEKGVRYYPTRDIKLAACLISLGVPYRQMQPVTREILNQEEGGKKEITTFWLDITAPGKEEQVREIVRAYIAAKAFFLLDDVTKGEYLFDIEHPLYYMMGVLFNRETLMHWHVKNAEPMRIKHEGNRTIMISARASEKTKEKLRKYYEGGR